MINESLKLSLKDLVIVPNDITNISSRKECNPYYDNMLPLFAAPMTSVCDGSDRTLECFIKNKITPIVPRTVTLEEKLKKTEEGYWVSYGLDEFIETYIVKNVINIQTTHRILIDIANGHMSKLVETIKMAKEIYSDSILLMAGNIANPKTIKIMSDAGCDYIRVGIGAGNACTTSANTGVHYPMASLIDECFKLKQEYNLNIKIVADGGMQNFDDVIKALSLGADYVMVGSIFNKTLESSGKTTIKDFNKVNDGVENVIKYENKLVILNKGTFYIKDVVDFDDLEFLYNLGVTLNKEYYGMSTKKAQTLINGAPIKTAEGIVKTQEVKYTLSQWSDNFKSYLSSAMSYTNKLYLKDFIGGVELVRITNNSLSTYFK